MTLTIPNAKHPWELYKKNSLCSIRTEPLRIAIKITMELKEFQKNWNLLSNGLIESSKTRPLLTMISRQQKLWYVDSKITSSYHLLPSSLLKRRKACALLLYAEGHVGDAETAMLNISKAESISPDSANTTPRFSNSIAFLTSGLSEKKIKSK